MTHRIRPALFAAILGAALPSGLPAWEGHDWNRWKEVAAWEKPDLRTDQTGRRDLAPLLGGDGGRRRIDSVRSWEERRAETSSAILGILGKPRDLRAPPAEARVLGEEVLEDCVRRKVSIRSEPDDWIPAYLLIPKTMPAHRLPAMVCLHQTVAQGKEEPCGIRGDPELAFALELVRRGYVCIAPDAIGFGERIPPGKDPYHDSLAFYRKHPGWSFLGKMVWDVGRAVDFLETLPFVDPSRIGCIGHSHGGYGTLFAAAFEPRIAAAVASCGFTPFRSDPTPERWSHRTALVPQLGHYLPDSASIPFDWHHACALIAPRRLFVWYATKDAIFPGTEGLEALFQDVKTVYDLHGAGGAIAWRAFDGPHRFPVEGREAAYRWLEAVLPRGSGPGAGGAPEKSGQPPPAVRPPESPPPASSPASGPPPRRTAGAFFPPELAARARANARKGAWAAGVRDSFAAAAEPWMKMSEDDLWGLMFGNTIRRSWMVWSNGCCPACRKPVPMYEWIVDPLERPWKMRCPRCRELFPKNDFLRFYRSGLNEQGIFDPARADRSLLFNEEHPGEDDPLRRFGVDDGEGYVEDGKRWRFIGAYLIYGQWKGAVVGGIRNLAAAYLVTGDPAYSRRAGILLDRVADLYPSFDFGREGVLYEGPARSGYVSTWHDACVEVRDLALAYDAVLEGLAGDPGLVQFLAAKAARHKLQDPKSSFAHVRRNIEEGIFRDTLRNRPKIESNYPSTDVTIATILTALDWPANREEVLGIIDGILARATAVDGVSGEKGLDGYSTIAPRNVAELLGRYARMDPGFIGEMLRRRPRLHEMYRFHLDTWCLGAYYPRSGDTGSFAVRSPRYAGLDLSTSPGLGPSSHSFLWELFRATGDRDFVRLLGAPGSSADGLPRDLFAADSASFPAEVAKAIAEAGPIRLGSVDKREWHLAILRAGEGADARAAWLDYDSGGGHGHADGMTIGLFAKGLDLLPDFGYPPVQYGGWGSPRATWYTRTAAHNTVAVDGGDTRAASGATDLWLEGRRFRAVRASGAGLIGGGRYERTIVLADVSDRDSYLVDVFRAAGGREHAQQIHGPFGRISTAGLSLGKAEESRPDGLVRGARKDPRPPEGWTADWTVEDRLRYLPPSREVHLRYTDLTRGAEAEIAEAWVSTGLFEGTEEAWIPRAVIRRRSAAAPLASTFLGVFEPYEGEPAIAGIRRLEIFDGEGRARPEGDVGLEVRLADGRRDILLSADIEGPAPWSPTGKGVPVLVEKGAGARLEGDLCLVRLHASGRPERVAFCRGRSLRLGDLAILASDGKACFEIDLDAKEAPVAAGPPDAVLVEMGGARLWPR